MSTRDSRGTSGGGNIRQRPDGRWEGRYTAGIDPGTGKQIQKSIYGKTQKEVRERLRKITRAVIWSRPNAVWANGWISG